MSNTPPQSCGFDDFDDIFGIGVGPIIKIDEKEVDEAFQRQSAMLWQRIATLSSPGRNAIEREANAPPIVVELDSSADMTDEWEEDFIAQIRDGTSTQKVETAYGEFYVPIIKRCDLGKWMEMAIRHEARIKEEINILAELEGVVIDYNKVCGDIKIKAKEVKLKVKSDAIREVVYKILTIQMIEARILGKIKNIADLVRGSTAVINDITAEISLKLVSKRAETYFTNIAANRIVLDRRYGFKPDQVKALINLVFSNNPSVRADAKLALCANMTSEHYSHVIANPPLVLATAISEAKLTCSEVLTMLFPAGIKGKEHRCVACETSVSLDGVIYHKRCSVIQWLEKHCQFSYEEGGFLQPKMVITLSPRQRARLYQILKIHALLSRDVVINGDGGFVAWSRTPDGKLQRRVIDSRDASQIVGTPEWLTKHGYIQRR